jgi:ABC-2 type transport system permease protein
LSTGLSFVPGPAANSWSAMVVSHARMELRLLVRNGEQLLLALVIPLLLLTGGAESGKVVDLGSGRRIDVLTPGVVALAVMSTSFTSLAIATAFERRYGVLKRLGASPLSRAGLLTAKTAAVLCLVAVQVAVLAAVGVAIGWRPHAGQLPAAVGATVLATAAYCGLALAIASLLRPETVTAAATAIYVLMLAAGGIMFTAPDLGEPGLLLLPLAAHAQVLRAALTDGVSVSGWAWLSLSLWAALSLVGASRVFRWE